MKLTTTETPLSVVLEKPAKAELNDVPFEAMRLMGWSSPGARPPLLLPGYAPLLLLLPCTLRLLALIARRFTALFNGRGTVLAELLLSLLFRKRPALARWLRAMGW
jgi:uncharacterized protein (DUF934 family)